MPAFRSAGQIGFVLHDCPWVDLSLRGAQRQSNLDAETFHKGFALDEP